MRCKVMESSSALSLFFVTVWDVHRLASNWSRSRPKNFLYQILRSCKFLLVVFGCVEFLDHGSHIQLAAHGFFNPHGNDLSELIVLINILIIFL